MNENEKLKIMIRVLNNGKVMVKDFSEVGFEIFEDMNNALNYVKSQNIKVDLK